MKRLFLLIVFVMVMVVVWRPVSHPRPPLTRPADTPRHWTRERHLHKGEPKRRIAAETRRNREHALVDAREEGQYAPDGSRDEMHKAFDEARDENHEAVVSDDDSSVASIANSEVDGLPVRIVPGTRVTEAEARPPARAASHQSSRWTLRGRLSATEERAVADALSELKRKVASWLDPEVPLAWTPPSRMLDAMVVNKPQLKSIKKDYGEVFEATLVVDASPQRRRALIEVYDRQLVERRLVTLGATLAFILICLAAISGYIRADEATKGYYTNRLRMLTAAAVGASGVIIYHMLA